MRSVVFVFLAIVAASSFAHDPRPIYIEVVEEAIGQVRVQWRLPPTVSLRDVPVIKVSDNCVASDALQYQRVHRYLCTNPSLPKTLTLVYAEKNPSLAALVRVVPLGFPPRFVHAGPDQRNINLPLQGTQGSVWREYFLLGLGHILEAADHILFVVCMVLLAGGWQRVLLTVTGFTVAHSITLGAATLGLITVSIAPVEVLIALSIVFVAAELARGRQDTLSFRYPALVSSTFGLLHGLGFASALGDVGLPQDTQFAALLSFNLGVEAGQILIVLIAFLAISVLNRRVEPIVSRLNVSVGWVVGLAAAVWFYQRLLSL